MTILAENIGPARTVRGLLWFAMVVMVGCLYAAVSTARFYVLGAGDGGVLRPLSERVSMAALIVDMKADRVDRKAIQALVRRR